MMNERWTAAALLVVFVAAAAAHAAPPPDATAHEKAGTSAHQRGDYRRAIEEFATSYALDPAPVMLFNIAQAHAALGDFGHAISFYRRYLAEAPSSSRYRGLAETSVRELERVVAATTRVPETAALPPAPGPRLTLTLDPSLATLPAPAAPDAMPHTVPQPASNPGRTVFVLDPEEAHAWQDAQRRKNRNIGLGFAVGGVVSSVTGALLLRESGGLGAEIEDAHVAAWQNPMAVPDWGAINDKMARKEAIDAAGWVTLATGAISVALSIYFFTRPVQGAPVRKVYIAPAVNGAILGGNF